MSARNTNNRHISSPEKRSGVSSSVTLLTDDDLRSFSNGAQYRLYKKLGAHPVSIANKDGTYFAVWAPNAKSVSVIGDFNGWNNSSHPLVQRADSGIWERFVEDVGNGSTYKYHIISKSGKYSVDKRDPYAFYCQQPPLTASIIWDLSYVWGDVDWMQRRALKNRLDAPISIYEVHIGSWKRMADDGNRSFTYREVAPLLADHVKRLGFTHVEFLPVMEHPFYGSWGYQTTGYYAPTSRYGTPQDFMYLVDYLHQHGIGVILDWVPAHFPSDEHGLGFFDGTHLYEYSDSRKRIHPEWKSYIFDYSRNQVVNFLISSAIFWLDMYHADCLRVDGVASMLYLDYARKKGEWIPNELGGRENLDAVAFLHRLNEEVYLSYPDVHTIAEESTAWPMVSRPTNQGGLGFGMKWDMGWMHDTLEYMSKNPVHRKYHHNNLTFRMLYAYSENFVLPLSHDEVVYGKGSLIGKMPGDDWEKFANLRLLLGYMYTQPGKKLLFMGSELAQWKEWNHDDSLDWDLLEYERHMQIYDWLKDLNHLYQDEPALHEQDCEQAGFEWIDADNSMQSIIVFIRKAESNDDIVLVVCNFTPNHHINYPVGLPRGGYWQQILCSDSADYGGRGKENQPRKRALKAAVQGQPYSMKINLPPLAMSIFKSAGSSFTSV